ncbi:hypothetical protein DL96DRAFT_670411 [Flagelloscypha sp. PMI_526]|nr:hypothetical protein DL96DRAFT_670411 [Flagelloscypha sp. PMI_526]
MAPNTPVRAAHRDPKKQKSSSTKKEKVFHPDSRKAGQMNRKAVRKEKMDNLTKKRKNKAQDSADFHGLFFDVLPPDVEALSLDQLHQIIHDSWLIRNDAELEAERAERRKGRPKSMREMNLEQVRLRDNETYRTGLDVIDLTDPLTLALFRRWDQSDPAYLETLQCIRVNSANLSFSKICKVGKHGAYPISQEDSPLAQEDAAMDLDKVS